MDTDSTGREILSVRLSVLPDSGYGNEERERLARRLRTELDELDVDSVGWIAEGSVPAGAKGADPATLGAIMVSLSASGGIFAIVMEAVRDWLGRQTGRHRVSVTIDGDTIELERATADQQRELVEGFVRRHSVV